MSLSLNGHTKYMQNIHLYLIGWQVTKESTVVLAVPSCPMVKLDDKYYKLVDKMEALTEAPPSLLHAKSLTVKGPVKFVKGVVIKGDVTFENGEQSSVLYLTLKCIALWTTLPCGSKVHAGSACVKNLPDLLSAVSCYAFTCCCVLVQTLRSLSPWRRRHTRTPLRSWDKASSSSSQHQLVHKLPMLKQQQ